MVCVSGLLTLLIPDPFLFNKPVQHSTFPQNVLRLVSVVQRRRLKTELQRRGSTKVVQRRRRFQVCVNPYGGMSSVSYSSSSSTGNQYNEFGERFPILHCRCGHQLKIRTSWTNDNPGRRFWHCSGGGSHRHVGCGFVEWYDPPMCYRSKRIIPGLLKRINRLEEDVRTLDMKKIEGDKKEAENGLKKIVGIMLVIFVCYIATKYCGSNCL